MTVRQFFGLTALLASAWLAFFADKTPSGDAGLVVPTRASTTSPAAARPAAAQDAVPPAAQPGADDSAAASLKRKRIEEVFGWGKTVGGLAQLKVRGLDKVKAVFLFSLAAYNIVRLPKLLQPRGEMCLEGVK